MLLEFAIEEAKLKKKDLAICWREQANAFNSPFLMTVLPTRAYQSHMSSTTSYRTSFRKARPNSSSAIS
ncbi:hypothetical protein DAPPUDRAFT_248520 [Daphnia pulex]|uniref:Uncharacterized protein n=1 Tax=Daphnia pulex TaxID=6669 RepID=E9GUU1_DAPPU|nr:hypothetical protein DAPPUDRAFT_248520 [Daphnia pulex]|eukprot:EFX76885.1 hypothetical protein DAPPUDRAFT_248520 [Daphnia pulex]